MYSRTTPILLCLLCAGCAATLPEQSAQLPPGVYGLYLDNAIGAINQSSWALATPSRTRSNPIDGVKAVLAVEYLAVELALNPRWILVSSITKEHMRQARADIRSAVGIAPDAPPQLVINALLLTLAGLLSDDRATLMNALAAPVFSLPPERTLSVIADLPYVRSANIATSEAASEALPRADRL